MRLLVVEDSQTQAEALKLLLESAGYEVDLAAAGPEGLEKFRRAGYDLVLSDIVMPDLNGYELCSILKADPQRRHVPVVLLTELHDPMDIIRGLECGADNFITKPFEPDYLLSRVRAILETRNLRGPERLRVGIELVYQGRRFSLDPNKEQILDLLVSTFEEYLHQKKLQEEREAQERERERQAADELSRTAAELARSNADLEQFAHVAAHDLQQPLRTITAATSWLSREYKGKLDADADEFIEHARRAAERMQRLISDLLTYALVGASKPFTSVDTGAALEIALANLDQAVRETNAVVTREPLPRIQGDPTQITQLFQNLVGNALKFHGDRPPRVHIGAQPDGDAWVFTIRDEGIGIAQKDLERVFMLFERLTYTSESPGTGIGLALCRKIAHRHGGEISVTSRPGEGSEFVVRLPSRPVQPASAQAAPAPAYR